ncbi:hypothetical protein DEJ34_03890 [Curtobacterium sp. MCPF17_050]|uniref:hypothetical protein n=1 Tax=Curtobacterium sp. MCPF17_050 TaxID=2175664 RepID=UPI000D9D3298|nr:hypothetical protein [Curtobacterium sp. MCPF17_050]WIB16285.1 hypothetical protein DEJ34_03890 [Curtobacterium sp. MCPF17_050]
MADAIFKSAVNYGSQTIELRDDTDTDTVEGAIVTALENGGGWVSLPTTTGSRTILVTVGVPIDVRTWTYTSSNDEMFVL